MIKRAEAASVTEVEAERIVSATVISHAVAAETGMPSVEDPEVPGVTTDRVPAPTAAAAPPVWGHEAAEDLEAVVAEEGVGNRKRSRTKL